MKKVVNRFLFIEQEIICLCNIDNYKFYYLNRLNSRFKKEAL